MSSSKRQSLIMTGVGLILLSALILYFALSQPRISNESVIDSSSITISDSSAAYSEDSTAAKAISSSSVHTYTAESNAEETTAAKAQTGNTKQVLTGKINLNTCTAAELTAINGIGDTRADAIIQYREYLGGYTSVEQIKNIKGIGDKLYEKIAPYLTV